MVVVIWKRFILYACYRNFSALWNSGIFSCHAGLCCRFYRPMYIGWCLTQLGNKASWRENEDGNKKAILIVDPTQQVTQDGFVIGWNIYTTRGRRSQTVHLQIWRPVDAANHRCCSNTGIKGLHVSSKLSTTTAVIITVRNNVITVTSNHWQFGNYKRQQTELISSSYFY